MDVLTFDELDAEADAFDDLVLRSPLVDRYCSSTLWILPAHRAFDPDDEPLILRSARGYAPLVRELNTSGRLIRTLEHMWCLPSPLVGTDLAALAHETLDALAAHDWDYLVLSGLEHNGPAFHGLAGGALARGWGAGLGHDSGRMVASLAGGVEGFLERRSGKMRRNLRRERRRAAHLDFVDVDDGDPDALYARVQAVERRCWKGRAGRGIQSGSMYRFYEDTFPRLLRRGALRLSFARDRDRDVGYVFGGVLGDTYRGLQLSFDVDYQHLGVGNLLQLHTVERLCAEGVAVYDLGMEMAYKSRWADGLVQTATVVVQREPRE